MIQDCLTGENGTAALEVCRLMRQAGGRALLVGGCVRDALLGRLNKDIDVEVYGLPLEKVRAALNGHFEYSPVGMEFGVLKLHHADVDIALPRTENKVGAGHRGFVVASDPELSFEKAASRRDFTLNAILYDPLAEEIIDPLGGKRDLEAGILRHCSDHFGEDPLRVLRGMQFVSRFGFQVAPETIDICCGLSQNELASERLAAEWEKMLLKGKYLARGMEFLRECGWIRFYPELLPLIGCAQSPKWHPEGDVWNHTLQAMDAIPDQRRGENRLDDLSFALAVLCHDFGKPATSVVAPDGRITSAGHAAAGKGLAKNFLKRIWNETELLDLVPRLVEWHMEPYNFGRDEVSDRAYRRLAMNAKRLDLLYRVAYCDMKGTYPRPADFQSLSHFLERAEALSIAARQPKPLMQGRHLLVLGCAPGRQMGPLLKQAFEAQLDGEFQTEEEGVAWLKGHLSKGGEL